MSKRFLACTFTVLAAGASAQVDPIGRSVLFIRGADGTGGLGSGSTEHLSDINNTSTAPGNHGFGSLAALLRADGFTVTQWIESQAALTLAVLKPHRIVVFGSNNRVYSAAEVAAFHSYFDQGGSALFISDANWGPNWDAAPVSDNQFLARYGVKCYQDSAAGVPVMRRQDNGRFLVADHPTVSGPDGTGGVDDVAEYEGEGVSYFEAAGAIGFTPVKVVSATGFNVRLITGNGNAGATRPAGPNDVALFVVTSGNATVAGHFDRNTFFNPNGTGSNITRRNNAWLALDLFRFLASVPGSLRPAGTGCGVTASPILAVDHPAIGRAQSWTVTGATRNAPALLLLAPGAPVPVAINPSCTLFPDLAGLVALPAAPTDGAGVSRTVFSFPPLHRLSGQTLTGQSLVFVAAGPVLGIGELSSAVEVMLGVRR